MTTIVPEPGVWIPIFANFELHTDEDCFSRWLVNETETRSRNEWDAFELPESGAYGNYQAAKRYDDSVFGPGCFWVVEAHIFAKEDKDCVIPIAVTQPIVFEVMPRSRERTKVKAQCLDPEAKDYFIYLLAEIVDEWPEAEGARRAVEAAWGKDFYAEAGDGNGKPNEKRKPAEQMSYIEGKILQVYIDLQASGLPTTDEMIAARLPLGPKGKNCARETVNRKRNKMRRRGIEV